MKVDFVTLQLKAQGIIWIKTSIINNMPYFSLICLVNMFTISWKIANTRGKQEIYTDLYNTIKVSIGVNYTAVGMKNE